MGKWYVIEVIEHRNVEWQGSYREQDFMSSSRIVINTCPVVTLRSIDTRLMPEELHRISLLWEENAGIIEYTFWVSKNQGPGIWNSDIIQNGKLSSFICIYINIY
jgi:hypothetical protein